jgi:hypothetical protein
VEGKLSIVEVMRCAYVHHSIQRGTNRMVISSTGQILVLIENSFRKPVGYCGTVAAWDTVPSRVYPVTRSKESC